MSANFIAFAFITTTALAWFFGHPKTCAFLMIVGLVWLIVYMFTEPRDTKPRRRA